MNIKNVQELSLDTPEIVSVDGKEFFATVCIWKNGENYTTEWWVSRRFDWELQLVASIAISVWGNDLVEVRRKIGFLRDTVFKFVSEVSYANGTLVICPPNNLKYEIAKKHIEYHLSNPTYSDTKEKFEVAFTLAEQFRVKETAVLLAEVLSLNVRTMHDWIYQLRKTKWL